MANLGSFDKELRRTGLFDDTVLVEGRFDRTLINAGGLVIDFTGFSIASAESFGNLTLDPDVATINLTSIETGESFGTLTIQTGTISIRPDSISSAELFGQLGLLIGVALGPSDILPVVFVNSDPELSLPGIHTMAVSSLLVPSLVPVSSSTNTPKVFVFIPPDLTPGS